MNKIEKLILELCPNGVGFKKIIDIADILNGYSFKSNKYSNEGIRVVRISDVQK
jgi:type I restriction enzyme, S subunit